MECGRFCLRQANVAIGKNATFAPHVRQEARRTDARSGPFGLSARRLRPYLGGETGKGGNMFWIVAMAMALAAGALILWTLLRARQPATGAMDTDLAVYRAQLAEVGRDLERGIIGTGEADALRLEIKRRILDADRAARGVVGTAAAGLPVLPAAATAVLIGGAFLLYDRLGAPGYADLPHAGRVARAEAAKAARPTQPEAEAEAARNRPAPPAPAEDFAGLMDQLRAALADRPDDVTGLRLLAQNERRLGNLSAAARAQERLVAVLGDKATADDRAALADVLISAAGGLVTAEAEAAITATLRADPANGTARFYAGLLEAQTGRPDLAFLFWRDLRKDSPANAPWVPYIDSQMEMLAAAAGADYTPPAAQGPDAADMAAAAAMSEDERAGMIEGMVAGLEERLFTEGGSGGEWAQLLTALGVLGDKDRAHAAWTRAEAALKDQPDALAEVRAAADKAGVTP